MSRRASPRMVMAIVALVLTFWASAAGGSSAGHGAPLMAIGRTTQVGNTSSTDATASDVVLFGSQDRSARSDDRVMWLLALLVGPLCWRLQRRLGLIDAIGELAVPRHLAPATSPRGPPRGRTGRGRSAAPPITMLQS